MALAHSICISMPFLAPSQGAHLKAEPSTLETVQNVIAKQLSVQPSSVTPASKFADLGADSLDTVEIMMNLEENFKISLGEEGAEKIVTVQDAANMIQGVLSSSHKK